MAVESGKVIRIVILGGGFAGVHTARHLQRIWRGDPAVEVTLISRDNFFLLTPLLFEAGSGILEPRHAVNPIRKMFKHIRFVQANVEAIDLDARTVRVRLQKTDAHEVPYDHLVLALGGITNTSLVKGSEQALTFKTLGDAIFLRNHCIQRFERADAENDPETKRAALTFVIIGAGFVGVELVGELTEFLPNVAKLYPRVSEKEIRVELIEGGPRVAPEFDEELGEYVEDILKNRGVRIRDNTKVQQIDGGVIDLPDGEKIRANTIVIATGVLPSPIVSALPLEKSKKGAIVVETTMRVKNRPEIWALGDCASIPDPNGKPYPPLAQHALREAKQLAKNITAAIRGGELEPFVYHNKGLLAALGHYKGVGRIYKLRIKGFLAWWVWRSYYLFQMPRWERRIRVVVDWTISLMFKNDVVQLDLSRGEHSASARKDESRKDPRP